MNYFYRCAQSMEQTTWSTSAAIAAQLPSSSALEQHIFVLHVMMTSKGWPTSHGLNSHIVQWGLSKLCQASNEHSLNKSIFLFPRCVQLEGRPEEDCPLHVKHPPTGEEFALGCGVCRNAHTFWIIKQIRMSICHNLLILQVVRNLLSTSSVKLRAIKGQCSKKSWTQFDLYADWSWKEASHGPGGQKNRTQL